MLFTILALRLTNHSCSLFNLMCNTERSYKYIQCIALHPHSIVMAVLNTKQNNHLYSPKMVDN